MTQLKDESLGLDIVYLKENATVAIIRSLDNHPHRWTWTSDSRCYIQHESGKLELMVSGGDVKTYKPYKVEFGWIHRFWLRRAFKRWRQKVGNKLTIDAEKAALRSVVQVLNYYY